MFSFFLKYFLIYYLSTLTAYKFMQYQTFKKYAWLYTAIFSLSLTITSYFLKTYVIDWSYIIPLIIFWLYISISTQSPRESLVVTFFAFGINYVIFALTSFISIIIVSPICFSLHFSAPLIITIIAVPLHIFSLNQLLSFKRFKRGMPFLHSTSFMNMSTFVGIFFLFFIMQNPIKNADFFTYIFSFLILIILFFMLIHWWQAQITKSYKNKLMLRELESLRIELAEKEKSLVDLRVQNEELGRLIHHDNKRIPAMEHAVCEYLISDFDDIEATKERAATLRLEIESLSRNRASTLNEITTKKATHYSTGIVSLDTLLNYMGKRAQSANTLFSVHNTLELSHFVPKHIETEDFTHLLSDLLENALIATNGCENPMIQLQFYLFEKHFVIEIADSGIPFEAKSIVNFGLSRLTTHEDTGGSGIGLMDIWKIKESYGATLHIEEYETASPFTKKISLIFNHRNLYSVRTHRAHDITALSKRSDLKVYGYEE